MIHSLRSASCRQYSHASKLAASLALSRSLQTLPPAIAQPARFPCVGLGTEVSSGAPVRVAFVGAGGVNFGSLTGEGPWNHSARLQQLPGVVFSAVVDPNYALARQRIDMLSQGKYAEKWQKTKIFPSYHAMLADSSSKPDVAYIGLSPMLHGALYNPNATVELDLAKAGVHMFIEKPISSQPASEVLHLDHELRRIQAQNGVKIAVGYMLRYSAAALAAKLLLQQHSSQPLAINARYSCAYSAINKQFWWDVSQSGGPVMEMGTHFVDLMRFLGGEMVEQSVSAVRVGPEAPLCDLPPKGEQQIPMERRINRVTSAIWRFENGAVGTFMHSLVLHNTKFTTELEVLADGLHLKILDPYANAQLFVRYPYSDTYHEVVLEDTDMYMTEDAAFIRAIQTGKSDGILTPFSDSVKTYQATEWITEASYNDQMKMPHAQKIDVPMTNSAAQKQAA